MLTAHIEAIKKQWEDTVDGIVEALDKAMGGIYGSIEEATKAFER
jgi:hypothetical protein